MEEGRPPQLSCLMWDVLEGSAVPGYYLLAGSQGPLKDMCPIPGFRSAHGNQAALLNDSRVFWDTVKGCDGLHAIC